jgi:tetratricopeptide (TPR) repeat protein
MKHLTIIICLFLLSACAHAPKHNTLADIDISGARNTGKSSVINEKNQQQIRAAYAEYLKHASKHDISRMDALQRLAQLEFELTQRLETNKGAQTDKTQDIEDKIYYATLDRSIALLQTTLHDYPKAKNRDKTLYQLAKAYDQRGMYDKSIATLKILVNRFPKSQYYVESEFRLAEDAFSRKKYTHAEDMYTDIIVSPKNSEYLENAIYKRGWARFKQGFYEDAIEDFLHVVNLHHFAEHKKLNKTQQNQFNEYFRAIGLSFSYLGGAEPLDAYFKKHPGFRFIYHSYANVSDIYLKQQRYTDAADTLENFIIYHPKSPQVPVASIKILDIWKAGGFVNKLIPALERFYARYHPQSPYWSAHATSQSIYNNVTAAIRRYMILVATNFHKEYMALNKEASFEQANIWYQRYLKYYAAYSRQDNIHMLYAELLSHHKDTEQALANYEQAAYDSGVILNKDAAYATILLADQLYSSATDSLVKDQYLNKLIKYSLMYIHLYPHDPKSLKILTRASQQAYRHGLYAQSVKLTELYSGKAYTTASYNINLIKANSYFKLKHYQDAEAAYRTILQHYTLNLTSKAQINDNLAVAIYDQGKQAADNHNIELALNDYARIHTLVPATQVAPVGLYDAIVLCMDNKLWDRAIVYSKQFQAAYPNNNLNPDVTKKLSVAYLNSHQDLAAANELVKIARSDHDTKYKMAALWKAGELYESKHETNSAIHSFEEYARNYQRPFPQYMESMQKLSNLYGQTQNLRQADHWRRTILAADKRTPDDLKTDRTRLISSKAALILAQEQESGFASSRLTVPLQRSLKRKSYFMQKAVNLYGRASSYGIPGIATQATYSIAEIYLTFSKALLASERPKNLSKTELEQYNILLQDKSYPFEDKAIEFYATNLGHVKDGIYDEWMQKSFAKLKVLYPERYGRDVKLEPYINVLQ